VRSGHAPDEGVCRKPPGVDRPELDGADFSTLSSRQKTLKANIRCCGSDGPLHLLIGSTGIEGEGEWSARKHSDTKRRVWRKIHIEIDERTLKTRATEFTTSDFW
jgi:hypothetical protein